MQQVELTYEQWMAVHPSFRSMIKRVPHVAVYDDGAIVLKRVVFERPARAAAMPRAGAGQLRLSS